MLVRTMDNDRSILHSGHGRGRRRHRGGRGRRRRGDGRGCVRGGWRFSIREAPVDKYTDENEAEKRRMGDEDGQ